MIINYFEKIGEFLVHTTSIDLDIKNKNFSLPDNAVLESTAKMIPEKKSFIRVFDMEGKEWKYIEDLTGTKVYNKTTFVERTIGHFTEEITDEETTEKPIENEKFQKFINGNWIVLEKEKREYSILKRKNELNYLLANSDWTQLPDALEFHGAEFVSSWKEKRKAWKEERKSL